MILDNALESFDGVFSASDLQQVRNMIGQLTFPVHFAFITAGTGSLGSTDATADDSSVVFTDFTNSNLYCTYNDIVPAAELINTQDGLILPPGANILIWQGEINAAGGFIDTTVQTRNFVFTMAGYTEMDFSGGRTPAHPGTRYSMPMELNSNGTITSRTARQDHICAVCALDGSEVPRRLRLEGSIDYDANTGTYQHISLARFGLLIININSQSAKF